MRKLTLTHYNFMNWYLNNGSDQEKEQVLIALGQRVADILLADEHEELTGQTLLDEVNAEIIPLHLFDGFEEANENLEVQDVFGTQFEIELI